MEKGDLNFSIFPSSNFRLSHTTSMEEAFDHVTFIKWCRANWTVTLVWSAAYLIFVHLGTRFMAERKPYSLRAPLIIWNASLAVFSIAGSLRTVPELYYVLSHYGLAFSVCNPSFLLTNAYAFWGNLFLHSKLVELGDTVFIILRKQPLIFLHWYHHATVLVYTWYAYAEVAGMGRWFATMNFIVHAFMYTYYALRAARFSLPRLASMVVTSLQIAQMVIGLFAITSGFVVKATSATCQLSYENVTMATAMYLSYLILFVNFFYGAYLRTASSSSSSSSHKPATITSSKPKHE